jgi:hypothetical protein
MNIKQLAAELADLSYETGYRFKSGTPLRERLGLDRAEGLLKALEARGFVLSRRIRIAANRRRRARSAGNAR